MPFIRTAPIRPLHPITRAYLRRRGMGQDSTSGVTDLPDIPAGQTGNIDVGTLPTYVPVSSVSTGPSDLSTILASIPGLLKTGVQTYNVLQGPSLIAGTNAIYNPATGQYYNPTTGQVVNPTGVTTGAITADLSAYMPIILIGGGLFLVAMLFGGKH